MRKLMILCVASLLFSSCQDDEPLISIDQNLNFTEEVPELLGADAILIGTKNSYYNSYFGADLKSQVGTATAVFYSSDNRSFVNAGKVKIYNTPLTANFENTYNLYPTNIISDGIQFLDQVVWAIEGNEIFPQLNEITRVGWPYVSRIVHPSTPKFGDDISIVFEYLSNADYTEFRILDEDNEIVLYKRYDKNKLSHTFTSEDFIDVMPGVYEIQVEVAKIEEIAISGRRLYFLNREVVYSQMLIE